MEDFVGSHGTRCGLDLDRFPSRQSLVLPAQFLQDQCPRALHTQHAFTGAAGALTEILPVRFDGLRVVAACLDSPEAMRDKPQTVEIFLSKEITGLSVPLSWAMDLVDNNLTAVDFNS